MTLSRKAVQMAILAIALGLSVVLAVGVWRGKTQKGVEEAPGSGPSEAEMKLTDMEYTELQEGKRVWTLKASEAKYFQDEQKSHLTAVRLTLFLRDGHEILLESGEGTLSAGTKNIELWGSVRATLPQGYQLTTERAYYDHANQTISSHTTIYLTGPDAQAEGNRWEYRIREYRTILDDGIQISLNPAILFQANTNQ